MLVIYDNENLISDGDDNHCRTSNLYIVQSYTGEKGNEWVDDYTIEEYNGRQIKDRAFTLCDAMDRISFWTWHNKRARIVDLSPPVTGKHRDHYTNS